MAHNLTISDQPADVREMYQNKLRLFKNIKYQSLEAIACKLA